MDFVPQEILPSTTLLLGGVACASVLSPGLGLAAEPMYAAGIEPASEGRTDASVRQALLSEQEPDPAFGMAGVFLSLRRVLPNRYPLALDVERYVAEEQRLGRLLDYAVILPRLQRVYEWSAAELREPRLLELVRDGSPIYAWPFEERHVWRSPRMPHVGRVLERATRAG